MNPRVEADDEVTATAVVEDADTPIDQLTYAWTVSPDRGTFSGTGRQVRWKAPHLQTTPDVYTVTLTVTERYTQGGEAREHKVSSSVQVRYNDSWREVKDMAHDFLNDFANQNVSPDRCVRNFTDSCGGKADERREIANNRAGPFQILGGTFGTPVQSFNAGFTAGTIDVPCTFRDLIKATGKTQTVKGTCSLTAVYENWQWYLCTSRFSGTTTPDPLTGR